MIYASNNSLIQLKKHLAPFTTNLRVEIAIDGVLLLEQAQHTWIMIVKVTTPYVYDRLSSRAAYL